MSVTITAPAAGATIRGTSVAVSGSATDGGSGHGLDDYVVCLQGQDPEPGSWSGGPHTANWGKSFDTTLQSNGSKTIHVCAACLKDPPDCGDATRTVTIDNHYLMNVVRGTEASYGSLRWKYLNQAGNGWVNMAGPWNAITEGAGPDGCDHDACEGDRHNMCTNMDTPPYLKSGGETTYPTISGICDSWDGDSGSGYDTDSYQGHDYYVTYDTRHVVGRYVVLLPNASGLCHTTAPYSDCWRTGIQIHGGSPTTNFAVALAATQALKATHGCVRVHNSQLQTLVESYIEVYQPRVGWDHIHMSVPDI